MFEPRQHALNHGCGGFFNHCILHQKGTLKTRNYYEGTTVIIIINEIAISTPIQTFVSAIKLKEVPYRTIALDNST